MSSCRATNAKGLEKRTGLAAALELVAQRQVDAVLFVAFDRLSRSERVAERGQLLGCFQDAGCKIVISGGRLIDLGTFQGRLEAGILLELAAEESAEKSRRAKRGRASSAAAGRAPCPPPLGLVHGAGGWQESPAAEVVREVYRRVAAGESASAVGEDLHRRGVPTARGGRWGAASVCRLVRCEVYDSGRWAANLGAVVVVPALVAPDLAAAARAQLERHQLRGRPRARQVHLLEALGRCGLCGSRLMIQGMVRRHIRGGRIVEYRYSYYACERVRHAGRRGACSLPRQHAEEVDARVWAALERWLAQPELVREALLGQGGEAEEEGRAAAEDAAGWRRRLEALPADEARVLERERRGLLSPAAAETELRRLVRAREALEQQLRAAIERQGQAARAAVGAEELRQALGALAAGLGQRTAEERRELVRALAAAVTVYPDRVRLDLAVWPAAQSGTPKRAAGQREMPLRAVVLA